MKAKSKLRLLPLIVLLPSAAMAAPSVARLWNDQILEAIRNTIPNPPLHARNLFHTSTAMYNAWAAYDAAAVGYIYNEKVTPLPMGVEAARDEAVSYAAHRVLMARFGASTAIATELNSQLTELGYSTAVATAPVTGAATPAELGKRIGQAVLIWSASDLFDTGVNYPQAYTAAVNPNMDQPLSVLGLNHLFVFNMQIGYGIPSGTNPNLWQPLAMSASITQNGIVIPGGVQPYLGVQGMATTPFSLTRTDNLKPWIDLRGGPSRLSTPGNPSPTDAAYRNGALEVVRATSQLNDQTNLNISPAVLGNNPLGADNGPGYGINPVTGGTYAPSPAKRGDFARVLAEFWADGPKSETPPGHWHVLANQVTENPALQKRVRGTGPVVSDLEWDVKMYFSLSAATHDAACAAWALKRYYSGTRPITMIRYLAARKLLPLEPGVSETVTSDSVQPGQRHEKIWDVGYNGLREGWVFVGETVVFSYPGEHQLNAPPSIPPVPATQQNAPRWMRARDWLPFQRKTFVTPAFPGYVSGHSCFSRAAAEALTLYTGSKYFPGGFHHHTVAANSMQIDRGPSAPVDLQWCSYYDAADQAGQSRIWGGIHVKEDDYHGRETGAVAGISAYTLAEKYWTGAIKDDVIAAQIEMQPGNQVRVTWNATRGMYHKVQTSTALSGWVDASSFTPAYDTKGEWTDTAPAPGSRFYRIVRSVTGA